jgi:hypothetical protein
MALLGTRMLERLAAGSTLAEIAADEGLAPRRARTGSRGFRPARPRSLESPEVSRFHDFVRFSRKMDPTFFGAPEALGPDVDSDDPPPRASAFRSAICAQQHNDCATQQNLLSVNSRKRRFFKAALDLRTTLLPALALTGRFFDKFFPGIQIECMMYFNQ